MKALAAGALVALALAAPGLGRDARDACDQADADAIGWMQYARQSHVWWRDYGSNYPADIRLWVGEPELHAVWVRRYEVVLERLQLNCEFG